MILLDHWKILTIKVLCIYILIWNPFMLKSRNKEYHASHQMNVQYYEKYDLEQSHGVLHILGRVQVCN